MIYLLGELPPVFLLDGGHGHLEFGLGGFQHLDLTGHVVQLFLLSREKSIKYFMEV